MSALRTPGTIAALLVAASGALYVGKSAHAQRESEILDARARDLGEQVSDLEGLAAETAKIRSETGTVASIDAERRAVAQRALARKELPELMERLRATAKRYALGPFDAGRSVRQSPPVGRSDRIAKVDFELSIATDWPRLGALLAEVRSLGPRVALEEVTVRRAEEVPLLGVKVVVAVLVAEKAGALPESGGTGDRFAGPSPFFLADELASGHSRRMPAPWTPPRVELEGVIYSAGASQVIVNEEPVSEGKTFHAGDETVKVLSVTATGVRFQCGERIFERELPPLSKGGGK